MYTLKSLGFYFFTLFSQTWEEEALSNLFGCKENIFVPDFDLFSVTNSIVLRPEAATRGVLCKKVFLEILQNSQENTCARVSFLINLQVKLSIIISGETSFLTHHISVTKIT